MNLYENLKTNGMDLPNYSESTIVDLFRMIYKHCGCTVSEEQENKITELENTVKNKKHIIAILVDGMGSNLVDFLPNDNILKKNKKMDLKTVNPSSTGAVLTTIATAEYPSKHGIIGWYSYNRQKDTAYYPMLFKDRTSEKDLCEWGLNTSDIFVEKSVMNQVPRDTKTYFPNYIVNSKFSQFIINDEDKRIGYNGIADAFDKVAERIKKADKPTFTYLYISDIDSKEHDFGVYHENVLDVIKEISDGVSMLNDIKNDDTEIIITADHGQIDVKDGDVIMDFEKYNKYFYAMPGIDFGTATYYIHENMQDEFEKEFEKDFAGKMFLYKTEDYFALQIFGKGEVSKYAQSNFGEYISFCKKGCYLINSEATNDYLGKIGGCHSGFSKEEFTIPLIVM